MKKLFILLIGFTAVCALNAQNTLTVTHTAAGSMATEITTALGGADATTIETLVVTGTANLTYDDCHAIASAFTTDALKTLDLSAAKFENNAIPDAQNNCGVFNLVSSAGMLVTEVKLPANLEIIGIRAFLRFANLTTINLPAGLKTIKEYAFYECKFLELSELPAALTFLGPNTFYQTSVSISAFPAGITNIPSNCFNPNAATVTTRAKITSLTFHANIANIDAAAFKTQVNLTNITVNRLTPPTTAADAFDGIALSNIDLYVPTGSSDNYNAAPWNGMNIHEIEVGTLTVTHTTEGNLATEITTALNGAEAASITKLVINGSANLTYDDCQAIAVAFTTANLQTLDLSNAKFENNTIPNAAANNCGAFNLTTASGLLVTSVILPADLEVIGTRAFLRFPNLTTINLPNGLKTIRANAFYGCNALTLSELPSSLTALVEYAFFQTSVSIGSFPAGITIIPSNCFNTNGSSLRAKITSLDLHADIAEIATKAFAGQTNLTSIIVNRATPPTTVADAFDGITLSGIDLYIPAGSEAAYDVEPWKSMNIHATLTGIDVVSPNEQANLVSVKYYNLQGAEITAPSAGGIYIVKKIYDNNSVKTEKILNSK